MCSFSNPAVLLLRTARSPSIEENELRLEDDALELFICLPDAALKDRWPDTRESPVADARFPSNTVPAALPSNERSLSLPMQKIKYIYIVNIVKYSYIYSEYSEVFSHTIQMK